MSGWIWLCVPLPLGVRLRPGPAHDWPGPDRRRHLAGDGRLAGRECGQPALETTTAQRRVAGGSGLSQLHNSLPVSQCPFDWSVAKRLARAGAAGLSVAALRVPPAIDQYVVCHCDAGVPNTLIDDPGRRSGHVDLGSLGGTDRRADLAVATMSLDWNYGPGWQNIFLEAYGVGRDQERRTHSLCQPHAASGGLLILLAPPWRAGS